MKHGRLFFLIIIFLNCSCIGSIWTGISLVYDRHNTYKKINNYYLSTKITHALYPDRLLKCDACNLDLAVFNGDVLLAGHLPSKALLDAVHRRLRSIKGYRRLFVQIILSAEPAHITHDAWITTKIRGQIFADDSIDPHKFKVITVDGIVYLMGDVNPDEAEKVVQIARFTEGVKRVVKMMRYFTYQTAAATNGKIGVR